ncbi:hypothetical protein SDC9_63872 [bioreactor metagenome]|uniref:Uncharacterized protein n=1 Tax=bioreactor metagenome TaxID=1076179 RepID=A0A644XNB4_9ZZZZ
MLCKLHGKRQPRLPAERGEQAVRLLLFDDARKRWQRQGFNIDAVRHRAVGHDRCRVGIDENDFQSFFFERAAGLRASIIEFRGLTDDDRPRADDHDAPDVWI